MFNIVAKFQTNPKKLYEFLRQIQNSKFKPRHVNINGSSVFDPKQFAEAFNSYFNSTFSSSEFKLPQVSQLPTPSHQLSKIQIDRDDVFEALTGLNASKAPGCDDIHPIISKKHAETLTEPIYLLFSKCLQTNSIPLEWKIIIWHKRARRLFETKILYSRPWAGPSAAY